MKYEMTRKWILFLIFIFFLCSGHTFWPFQKRNTKIQKELTRTREKSNSKKENTLEIKGAKENEEIIIESDTTWSGKLEIKHIVVVKKGACLTIKPGTELIFSGPRVETEDIHKIQGGGMKIEGQMIAVGTKDSPVIFTGKEKNPGGWGSIYLNYSQDDIFKYCIFEYANFAVHSHFSSLTISYCLFENNNEGCRLGFSQALIENSIFRLNEFRGINFKAGKNEIRNNSIVANNVGLFVNEKGGQSKIYLNNIYNNGQYNVQLGDFSKEDVSLEKIYLGKNKDWRKTVHDNKNEGNMGQIKIEPIDEEIHWDGEEAVKNLK